MIKSKDLALGAMGCALSFLFLICCSAIPTGKLAMGFIASFVPCIIYIESSSLKTSLLAGISAALLALIILPKSGLTGLIVIMYSLCFCYYPALKAVVEKKRNLVAEWFIKLIYFSALSLAVKLITVKFGICVFNPILGVIGMVAYDILLTYLVGYYIRVISPRIKKSR